MNRGKQHIDEELLIRFIIGEANNKESILVKEWIDLTHENQLQFEELQKIWSAAEPTKKLAPEKVNVDAAWKNLKSRMDQFEEIETKYKVKQRSLSFYMTRVAAVILLGTLIYAIYNYQFQRPQLIQLSSNEFAIPDNSLSDGTLISLNQNTTIEYPEQFSENQRKVKLTGEAFFNVEPDLARPFIVEANEAIITVLGTSFNVKAFPGDLAVEVLVEEGLVELANADQSQSTKLRIGEKGIYLKETNEVKKETEIDAESLFWLNKTLLFRDTKLSMVFETLARLYDINVKVENERILHCKLTAKFSNETIDNILDHISTIFNLEIEKNDNNFLIKGNGCP